MTMHVDPRSIQLRSAAYSRAIARGFAWLLMLGTGGRLMAVEADVSKLTEHLGGSPALVVAVCEGDETSVEMVKQLVDHSPWIIFCRNSRLSRLDLLRDWARDTGQLGRRVYVVDDAAASLGLADGMADAVWVAPGVSDPLSEREIMRVLHPGGIHLSKVEIADRQLICLTGEE